MKVLVQRVYDCTLKVEGELISKIEKGLLVYLGEIGRASCRERVCPYV